MEHALEDERRDELHICYCGDAVNYSVGEFGVGETDLSTLRFHYRHLQQQQDKRAAYPTHALAITINRLNDMCQASNDFDGKTFLWGDLQFRCDKPVNLKETFLTTSAVENMFKCTWPDNVNDIFFTLHDKTPICVDDLYKECFDD